MVPYTIEEGDTETILVGAAENGKTNLTDAEYIKFWFWFVSDILFWVVLLCKQLQIIAAALLLFDAVNAASSFLAAQRD